MTLKWSQFVFWVESRDKQRLIARNTLTTSTIRMTKEIKDKVDTVLFEKQEVNTLSTSLREYIKKLLQLEMIIPSALNEKEKYLRLFHDTRTNDKTFGIYLVATRNCQLDCPYCFERSSNRKESLNIKTAEEIIYWSQNYLNGHPDCDKLRVVLYGGEPLLNKKAIKYILPKFYELAKQKGILFEVGILTNGELLDLEILSFLKKYNLDRVQITLDGPREIHDKRRVRKNGKGTFQKILQNILIGVRLGLLKKIHLRINFDRQNIDSIPSLIELLGSYNLQKVIKLSFGIITATVCSESGQRVSDSYFAKFGLSPEENATKYLWLCQAAKDRGFNIPKEYLAGPWCTARKIHSAVVEPDGSLLKCISTVGRKEFIFGNIFSTRETLDRNFSNFSYIEECLSKNCPFVPICGGGCRFEAFVASGSLLKAYCQRELIEKINKGLTQLNFE